MFYKFKHVAPRGAALIIILAVLVAAHWSPTEPAFALSLQQDTLLIALDHPVGVAVDKKGNIYFTEFGNLGNGTLRKLGADGQLETLLMNLASPAGVAVDSRNSVYFAESATGTVTKLDLMTGIRTVVASNLPGAWSVAVDASDNLYVSQRTVDGSIVQVSHDTFQVTKVLSGLRIPAGVYIDSDDTLYFAEFASNTERIGAIKRLSLRTNSVETIITDLPGPYAVLVTADGTIYFTLRTGELKRISPGSRVAENVVFTNSRVYSLTSWQGDKILFVKFGSPIGSNDGSLNLLGGTVLLKLPSLTPTEKSVIKDIANRVKPRVEEIRGLSFKHEVNVTAVYREFLHKYQGLITDDPKSWQLAQIELEGLHFLRTTDDAKQVVVDFLYAGLLGFYEFESEKVVIVTSERDFQIDEVVLAHELTHALTAQYFATAYQQRNVTTDQSLALNAILEGDARLVQLEYERRCDSGIYRCVRGISAGSSATPSGFVSLVSFPYLAGYDYVFRRFLESGPTGIDFFYSNPPNSSTQIIHFLPIGKTLPQLVSPTTLQTPEWEIIGDDTLGEASINSMFQNFAIVPRVYVGITQSYNSASSNGWAADRMTMYSNGLKTGYVWRILWNSERDAEEFVNDYAKLLEQTGTRGSDGKWQLRDSRILWFERQLNLVTIVSSVHPNLDEIFPPISNRIISIDEPQTESIRGDIVRSVGVGKPVVIEASIRNTQPSDSEATIFVVIRRSDGQLVNQQTLKTVLGPLQTFSVQASWTPNLPGDHVIETFVLKSPEDPTPLSKITSKTISITG